MSAHYDDPDFFYDKYWLSRSYEHASEEIAIRRLIGNKHFSSLGDVGGGYGRLSKFLTPFSKKIYLIEPSAKQLRIATKYLSGYSEVITNKKGTAEATTLPDASLDIAVMVRVMHHLPDPLPSFRELYRVIRPGGYLLLEVANSAHFKARVHAFFNGHSILPTPIERRSTANIKRHTIPFVNHHPSTVLKQLTKVGFIPQRLLSVSNFRFPLLKQYIPYRFLLSLESLAQPLLSKIYFGPSIFILCQKPQA